MFKLFQKKKAEKANMQAKQAGFLSAKQALEETSKVWETKTRAEILEKIKNEVKRGQRHACFIDAYIKDEDITFIRKLGYQVSVLEYEEKPAFIIRW